ncbi:(2Fe-2S) ferredoxin domain-containing protein [Blastomonas sp.]|uniref:(2Fe-2S) ferredoxin domain-containing protein n=1 Tax=Blastomonas sp. TaxID=1909299 RepID=UPI0035930BED
MKTEVRANWSHTILICKKCQKRAKAAFGPEHDKSLSKALKRRLTSGKGRKARLGIVEVGCLDICPKKGVVLIDSRAPGIWRIVRDDADIDRLAEELAGGAAS